MKTIKRLWQIIIYPRRTAEELVADPTPRSAFWVVLGLGLLMTFSFGLSAWQHDYPPAPDVLQTWIEAYGEFGILPFLKIPPENYRLVVAVISLPLMLSLWALMAGWARLISILFKGKVSFDQYLNLFGFSFFVFWLLAFLLDTLFEIPPLGNYLLPSLRGAYGPIARGFYTYWFSIEWTLLVALGGVWNGIVCYFSESDAIGRAASRAQAILTGLVTMAGPILAASFLIR